MASTYATNVDPLVLDLESAPLENVRDFLEPPDLADIQAPSNYVKPEAIEAYIAREKAKRLADFGTDCTDKAALDFNMARITCLGVGLPAGNEIAICRTEDEERAALGSFWRTAEHRLLVGFKIREFDLPMLIQRSRYLDVPHHTPDLGRYARGSGIIDLYDLLTFNDMRYAALMPRSLKAFARRFGLAVPDLTDGKDMPALVAAGDWTAVANHCAADLDLTVALACRLGVIQPRPALVAF